MTWLFLYLPFPLLLVLGVVFLKMSSPKDNSQARKTYLLTFPNDLTEERVLAWMRSNSGALHSKTFSLATPPSIVYETWSTSRGISHRLLVPWKQADFIVSQLRSHIPGVTATPDDSRPNPQWTYAVELGMTSPSRQLRINSSKDVAASLLASVQALKGEEIVVTQWVVTPAQTVPLPAKESTTNDFSFINWLVGSSTASSDEIEDRRKKMEQPNLLAVCRIGATASTPAHAQHLVGGIQRSLASVCSHANRFRQLHGRLQKISDNLNRAASPMLYPAQVSLPELAALVAFPIGSPFVAGLPQGSTRHLHANEDILEVGRVLGHSNYPGHERPIAQGYAHAVRHTYIGGTTGSGKSTMMANAVAQDMANGYGAIVIDASNSDSSESLFSRAVNFIPKDRLDDVIIMDVNKSRLNPVGFNILDQGSPRIVVDQITDLFGYLYQDTKGVWTRELLFHGLYTLAEHPELTFVDLTSLLTPRTKEEIAWSDEIVKSVKDPELRLFWQRWQNFSQMERDRYSQPLLNRAWQLISRPETRNIIGQSTSSFQMKDVLMTNKILLISLAGLPEETATLLGTLMVNALWTAAQTMTPDKPNFLYLDEFQLMTRLPMGLDDMLARARKHRLGVTLATQFLATIPEELKAAVINNTGSRVIFQSSSKEARMWQQEFGRQHVDENDFMHIRKYEAIAQLATDTGTARPVTLRALPPGHTTNVAREALAASSGKYGRRIEDIEQEMVARRSPTVSRGKRPNIGIREM